MHRGGDTAVTPATAQKGLEDTVLSETQTEDARWGLLGQEAPSTGHSRDRRWPWGPGLGGDG